MSNHSSTTSTKADSLRRIEVITGIGRRRHWTDEEKAWIVAESLEPTTTVSAVARMSTPQPCAGYSRWCGIWRDPIARRDDIKNRWIIKLY
jgi:hypothetical protein